MWREPNQVQLSNPRTYEGSLPEVGTVLVLEHEKFDKKAQFQVFMDRLSNYSILCLRDSGDLTHRFKKMENPRPFFPQ